MQVGATVQLNASARNNGNTAISPAFTFASSNPGVVDVAPNGAACAGTWNAPLYSICTPAATGTASVTASALGVTSPPTLIFVHPPIDNIQVSVVPPVNSPPPACPNQQALPAACMLPFNANLANYCLSQNQTETLQAKAFSQGVDITGSVGPFTWSEVTPTVATITPIVTTSDNVATNQATASPGIPGQTQVIASASGASSQPFYFESCPVQCIALELGVNGSQRSGATSFVTTKGTAETITATAVDVQGCTVPKPPLTWVSSSPAAISAGGSTGCAAGTTCALSTTQAGAAAITASCSPPTCNVGFPLNPAGLPAPYIPQPVYPVTTISGLVTVPTTSATTSSSSTATSTSVLVTSQDCYSDAECAVGLYSVATSTNLPGGASQLPTPPNSLMFDPAGDRAYMGSGFGAVVINPASIGSSTSPFTSLAARGTPRGLVAGRVLAVSQNGNGAIFSDTVSTPNQVYVVNVSATSSSSSSSSSTSASAVALDISNATAATFSPDGLKAFILGGGGNSLYVYSTLQALQPPITLTTPATSVVFSSSGSFALLSGGGAPSTLAIYNTCDNSAVSLPVTGTGLPSSPIFLKMVPAGNVPMGNVNIPALDTTGLDFFFGLDSTGIDIIATNSSMGPLTTLCPQQIALAHTPAPLNTTFAPVHINIGQGTFHPINFFLSPDCTRAYIIAGDRSSVLVYDFTANATSGIPLMNNATPVSADMSADGTLIYVAGSDGLLHELNTALALDQNQVSFLPLPNSTNNFCFTGTNCHPNIVAVKP
ncbi:MAG: hypothetical protein WB660_17300 [Candidatus Sulfotelmatobacter sp.]